jgi:hypothetical protein
MGERTADLSTALRSGRDDKGEANASGKSSCWTDAFHHVGWVKGTCFLCRKTHFQEGTAKPQISPLRCAPVEMTKGRPTLPGRVVAGHPRSQDAGRCESSDICTLFSSTLSGSKAHDSSVENTFPERTAEPQVPPLRYAPVEMTKGRPTLPGRVVAGHPRSQDAGRCESSDICTLFSSTLSGSKAHDSSVENTFPRKDR